MGWNDWKFRKGQKLGKYEIKELYKVGNDILYNIHPPINMEFTFEEKKLIELLKKEGIKA